MDRLEFNRAFSNVLQIDNSFSFAEKEFYLTIHFFETQKISFELIKKVFQGMGFTADKSQLNVSTKDDGSCEVRCLNQNDFGIIFCFSAGLTGYIGKIVEVTPLQVIWTPSGSGLKKHRFVAIYDLDEVERKYLLSDLGKRAINTFFNTVIQAHYPLIFDSQSETVALSFESAEVTSKGLIVRFVEK